MWPRIPLRTACRGRRHELDGIPVCVTYHPSAVLRADERASEIRAALVADLVAAREAIDRTP